jgi:hypothetical protein
VLRLEDLKTHTAIFGGSGSGKTVLLRRIVEGAALNGTPALVIDMAGDLAYLGRRWPEKPADCLPGDEDWTERYFERVEVKIWTPGSSKGNPLTISPIPDLAGVAGDPDLLQTTIDEATEGLMDVVNLKTDNLKEGVLAWCVRRMAQTGGQGLTGLLELLSELPPEAEDELGDHVGRTAANLAAHLRGAAVKNPGLNEVSALTPETFFTADQPGRTRLSVVNLSSLNSLPAKQAFVQKLVMSVFAWLTSRADAGLAGLLVLDEARDLIPSVHASACKKILVRYANQARKYGFGLILASQAIKSVDNQIVANCSNLFVGRQGSPAPIKAAEDLLEISGVANLENGQFFVRTPSVKRSSGKPVKIKAALGFSWQPKSPDPNEVMAMAAASRPVD